MQVVLRELAGREIESDAQIHHGNELSTQVDDSFYIGRHVRDGRDFHYANDLMNFEHG